MKPYMIVQGSSQSLEGFEQKVASALETGYVLAGELVAHTVSPSEIKFYQPVMLDDEEAEEDDEEEEDEEEEDDDE